MSNIVSKLTFKNVSYDLADESARSAVNNLENQLNATRDDLHNMIAAVGSPLVAATTSAMTDTSKIYVYTGTTTTVSSVTFTAGNWYYYDGTKWQLGGTYNETALETDTTLTVSGSAADAKVVGDALEDIIADDYETTATYSVGDYCLYNEKLYRCKTEISVAESWNSNHWTLVNVTGEVTNLKNALDLKFPVPPPQCERIEEHADLDDYTVPGGYIALTNEIAATVAHAPEPYMFCLHVLASTATAYPLQIFVSAVTGKLWIRSCRDNIWRAWTSTVDVDDIISNIDQTRAAAINLRAKGSVLDYSTITSRKRIAKATGVLQNATNQSVSDYIPISGRQIVATNVRYDSTDFGHCFYDIDKEFIVGYDMQTMQMEAPENAAYVRFTFQTAEVMAETVEVYVSGVPRTSIVPTRWLAMGDSITYGVYSYIGSGGATGTEVTDRCWVKQVATMLSYDLTVMASRGMGYTVTGHDPLNYDVQISLDQLLSRIEGLHRNGELPYFNLITLAFGINDYNTSGSTISGIQANLSDAIARLMAMWPKARLVVITPFNCNRRGDPSTNYCYNYEYEGRSLKDVADAIKETCASYGVECLYASNGFLMNNYNMAALLPDNTHPSEDCHTLIAKTMLHRLLY